MHERREREWVMERRQVSHETWLDQWIRKQVAETLETQSFPSTEIGKS